jgi:hypothetical protein
LLTFHLDAGNFAALHDSAPLRRPRIRLVDRVFWVLLRRVWSRWSDAVVIVRPETVVGWHRAGFALDRKWPLRRVHECVFGVVALESEPVDPRL